MKKWIALATAIIAMLAMAACQAPAPSAAPSDAAASKAPAAAAAGVTIESIKAKGELVVASNAEYPPFEMLDGDKFVGIDMEVAQAIADKLGVKLKIDNMSFDAVLAAIPTDKCDLGMSSLSITDERKKVMDFSDPYMETSIKMIVAKDSTIATLDDLKGKKIGVQLGTLADTTVASFVEGAEVSRMNKDSDAVMELINGRVDAVMTDSAPAQALVDKNSDKVKLVEEPLSSDKLAIATKKGNTELITFVKGVLKDMQADGSFQKIVDKYIPAAK